MGITICGYAIAGFVPEFIRREPRRILGRVLIIHNWIGLLIIAQGVGRGTTLLDNATQ